MAVLSTGAIGGAGEIRSCIGAPIEPAPAEGRKRETSSVTFGEAQVLYLSDPEGEGSDPLGRVASTAAAIRKSVSTVSLAESIGSPGRTTRGSPRPGSAFSVYAVGRDGYPLDAIPVPRAPTPPSCAMDETFSSATQEELSVFTRQNKAFIAQVEMALQQTRYSVAYVKAMMISDAKIKELYLAKVRALQSSSKS